MWFVGVAGGSKDQPFLLWQEPEDPPLSGFMNPLLRLLGAASSHGLLTGQIVFSTAFVGACELPNWIQVPRAR